MVETLLRTHERLHGQLLIAVLPILRDLPFLGSLLF